MAETKLPERTDYEAANRFLINVSAIHVFSKLNCGLLDKLDFGVGVGHGSIRLRLNFVLRA